MWTVYRIPTVKLKIPGKSRIQKFCYIQIIVFDLSYLRGGPNFGPVKYVKEVSHVKHMHANSILVHFNFSSKLMVT